jgi:septum site-determining protein MinD
MARIISVHSFRRGTGKSNLAANLAVVLAAEGRRVGLVDLDIQSPSIHIPFGLDEAGLTCCLNDYLWGQGDITQAVYNPAIRLAGQLFILPASSDPAAITRLLQHSYDPVRLTDGLNHLVQALQLELLLIDTHAGLNEETLLSMALCDILTVVLRPDQQDYQGTGITIEVARRLEVPRIMFILNEMPLAFDFAQVKARVEQVYQGQVAAILPHVDEMMALASADIFVLRYPDHPVSATLRQAAALLADSPAPG